MAGLSEQLWELQTEVSRLQEVEQALTSRPDYFAEVDDRYQQAKLELARGEKKLEELQKLRRDLDRELQVEQEALTRYQGQLMLVKNQQQYAAAWKEIDTARKTLKELEDAALARMQEIEEVEQQLAAGRSALEPVEQEHREAYERWQASLGDQRARADELKAKIASLEPGIPKPLLQEFHRIRSQRNGLAVARVLGSSCEGCRVTVRPAVAQQLRRGELMRCEGCRRILYLEPHPVAAQG